LLVGALQRLSGCGGDPVVKLQTNFGGGKTHSMLALYHLFSGRAATDLTGIEPVLQQAGVAQPPRAHRAVLVGTALNPATPRRKSDGTVTRTLWGEMAWQLGEAAGDGPGTYALVADADARGVSPGSDTLRELFDLLAPCLVLVDEWLAFVRGLYGVEGLPAGTFDANLTFVQALTEAALGTENTLLVASLPASDIEVGGEVGREALARLENTFARVEAVWRPASNEEGFEIVQRRLFEPITDPALWAARDAVVNAFSDLYRTQAGEFPSGCREGDYARRLKATYPIHPELFDRLFQDWSALERFQRTRGVLRLMAAVIHALWERDDRNLLILPGSVPIDDSGVQSELTRYLDDNWVPVIERDVDGPHSLPLQLDRDNPALARFSATRRVARTVYLGSAPKLRAANKGLDDRQVKLGCAQPGEAPATFGDALRRLSDQAMFLYVDGARYWYSVQPSVARLAHDRAAQQADDVVAEEIRKRLKPEERSRGDFARVQACPRSSGEVPDEDETRIVILGPEHPHAAKQADSPARQTAAAWLDSRGTSPRLNKNMQVFLAPDRTRLAELDNAVRQYLAWQSINNESKQLNLDPFQAGQAASKLQSADETVERRIPETYQWLLVPTQEVQGPLEWDELRLQGDDPLAVRASRRLRHDGLLYVEYGPTLLRHELDRIPLWRDDHVSVKQLWEDLARYLYLPRLRDHNVLLTSIQKGVAMLTWETETFAYAEGWDESRRRYLGLRAGEGGSVTLDGNSLLVKPNAARRQLDADEAARQAREPAYSGGSGPSSQGSIHDGPGSYSSDSGGGTAVVEPPALTTRLRRFHGTVPLKPLTASSDAGKVAEYIIAHLASQLGADVRVTLEIEANLPEGASDDLVRTVTENCRTLKFSDAGFEEA
jgi:predicted AAA+ superfamily ATPase